MSLNTHLPEYVTPVNPGSKFSFSCHEGVTCFTECCRLLELALTPYDVLRLRKGTGMSSSKLFEKYIITEHDPEEPFPRFYLTMVDDGRASCAFVAKSGCTVYKHRPAACRTYPLGRAVVRGTHDIPQEHYVLMKEDHCHGFAEGKEQDCEEYTKEQGLGVYNRFNDAVASILQHDTIRKGFVPSQQQVELYTLTLYNIDTFREKIFSDEMASVQLTASQKRRLQSDEQLLLFAIDWLYKELYPDTAPENNR